ncbi:hypothetical protein SUGI_0532620 [Cryptomeria japonica]|uniref:pathogenesis-related protein PRB1-2-like n=1 Tax=Cryptomeria japonica TaxID=3369 RepID=UPI002408EDA1|nr:pathogenesis-related protein PRB1-2-like [Cryptomeria japonica]GLJ27170.1 hypothetical protein SUGI_0532620 [Cryptomeria japonica]
MNRVCQILLVLFVVGLLSCVKGLTNSQAIADFTDPQNVARKAVGVPALKWNSTVAAFARNYARQRRNDCLLEHSKGSPYGDNILWGKGPNWTRRQAINAWIDERKWYIHASNTCTGPDCTHYTQIMWATTTSVGCSIMKCGQLYWHQTLLIG